ncbi:uncharacterized protein SAPINGB_P000506 [Magnusiomyces paraingens]|uniref:Uncharacterized protein n=1 Tax=Magnusiomyces paraingens TaxID=2606893 RepID=A0A5E8B0I2_9ASCO|nr:uncharacterized protein SAPINGB_P000506 [Saprochaete ingens]VVT44708.1 unnamed protein product [Saprochaete ingens]
MSTTTKTTTTRPWFKVPEPVRVIFDQFPLATYPDKELYTYNEQQQQDNSNDRKTTLYVYNIDEPSGLPTDPASIELLGLLRLKGAKSAQVSKVSVHSAPTNGPKQLPYLVDVKFTQDEKTGRTKRQRAVYSTPAAVRRNLLTSSGKGSSSTGITSGQAALYASLLSTAVHDAWIFTLLDNAETPATVREHVYGEGAERIGGTLPGFIERHLQEAWTLELAEALRPRYPAVVDTLKGGSKWKGGFVSKLFVGPPTTVFFSPSNVQGTAVREEVYARAIDALQVFSSLLDEAPDGFLGTGGSQDDDDEEEEEESSNKNSSEDVLSEGEFKGLGPLDILLFSYVYAIQNYATGTPLARAVDKLSNLATHALRVEQGVYKN